MQQSDPWPYSLQSCFEQVGFVEGKSCEGAEKGFGELQLIVESAVAGPSWWEVRLIHFEKQPTVAGDMDYSRELRV